MVFSQVVGIFKVSAMVKDSKDSAVVSKSKGLTCFDDAMTNVSALVEGTKVSTMVYGSKGLNFVIDEVLNEDGQDSAKEVQGDIEYDSSSSPYVMSPYGEDDSDNGENDQKNEDSLAMVVAEVIEDISP